MSLRRRILGALAGAAVSGAPALAAAQEASRALDAPSDTGKVVLVTALTIAGLLLLASIGRLYETVRGIRWPFQEPDPVDPDATHH